MNNTTAIVAVALGSLLAAVVVTVWSPGDNAVLITIIFGSAVSTIAGLLSLVKSAQNSADLAEAKTKIVSTEAKVQKLSIDVDGRLSQLLKATEGKALAEGAAQGVQTERDRTAAAANGPSATGGTPAHGHPIVDIPPLHDRAKPGDQS